MRSLLLSAAFVGALPARAGGPVVWETNTRAALLTGDARGVSVTDTGALMLAPRFAQLYDTEQAFVWSSAADAAGNVYLGTGHDGKIFRVGADGRGALLYDAAELDVTALAVGRDGALYAGTSPDGKVYRVGADGKAEVYFDPAGQVHLVARRARRRLARRRLGRHGQALPRARRAERSPRRRCSSTPTRRTSSRSPRTRRGI